MNIHLFMDPFGYYSFQFTERVQELDAANNIVVNINQAKINHQKIIYFDGYDRRLKKFLGGVKDVERIYFHYYNPIFQEINLVFKKRNPEILSVWCFWGGDLYSLPEIVRENYLSFSLQNTRKSLVSKTNFFRQIAVNIYYRLTSRVPYNPNVFLKSFEQIDYLAAYFKEDYEAVVRFSGKDNMTFFKFPYLSLELILGDIRLWDNMEIGEKIMVGHSADPGLNHFEIVEMLSSYGCQKTILLPMHYGDDFYKNKLLEAIAGLEVETEVIETYLPLHDYNKKLLEVGYAIFNVNHQQAFGNIITLVWLGIKVFLHEDSGIYLEFKRLGVFIYSIADLKDMSALVPLTQSQKEINKNILQTILSAEVTNEMNLNLLQLRPLKK